MENKIPKTIYHYCNSSTFFNIVNSRQLWLTDVLQSNDYMEMKSLYGRVLDSLLPLYKGNKFELIYEDKTGISALSALIVESVNCLNDKFHRGEINCFVICFSETGDLLSQWRGYANDSKGFSIGFSTERILSYINTNDKFLELSKINYKSDKELDKMAKDISNRALIELSTLRKFIKENMTNDPKEIDSLMLFNFNGMVESVIYESILIKHESFKEEKEWRLYTKETNSKNFIDKYEDIKHWGGLNSKAIKEIKDRIGVYPVDNQIKSYVSLKFDELQASLDTSYINKIIIGPKNFTTHTDLELFLNRKDLKKVKIIDSNLTYR